MPKSDHHHASLEEEGDNNIANTNNDRRHVPKSDRCREEEGDITNDRRQRHRPGTSGDEKLKSGHHPFSNIGIIDTNIPPWGDDCEDDDDSGEDEEIPNAAVATATSNPRRRSNPNGAVADEGGVATAASDPRRLPRRFSGGRNYDENVYHRELETIFRTSSNEDEEDDTEEEDEEGDTEESEDEAGVDSSSYGSSDEENNANRKKANRKKANRKKDGGFGPSEARKQAARKRNARDIKEGNPNGRIAHVQQLKLANGNVAHRAQLVLNGKKKKSGDYYVGWDVSDPRPEARYWLVKGTKPDLDDFGKDVSIPGASKAKDMSWFSKAKSALIKPSQKEGEKNRVIFKTYEEGDDIPDGCQANHSMPMGPIPKSRQNEIFTYYFYHPEFDHKYDALGLASFMKADSSDSNSSDSDSSDSTST